MLSDMNVQCTPVGLFKASVNASISQKYAASNFNAGTNMLQNGSFNVTVQDSELDNNVSSFGHDWGGYELSNSEKLEHILYTKVIVAIAILGVLGNMLNMVVLTRKAFTGAMERMEVSAHIGLISLAVSDCLFCFFIIPKSFIHQAEFQAYKGTTFALIYQAYGDAIICIFQMSSAWLTVNIAISRYLAVCHPFKARMFIGRTSAKVSVILAFTLAIVFNIPRFWEMDIKSMECLEGYKIYFVMAGFMKSGTSRLVYLWFYFPLQILIPLIVLSFCNINLVRQVRGVHRSSPHRFLKSSQTKSKAVDTLTLTLALIILFYIILVTPAEFNNFVLYVWDLDPNQQTDGYNLAVAILNTVSTLNFAINFILYCSVHKKFRQMVLQMVKCRMDSSLIRGGSSKSYSMSARYESTEVKQLSTFNTSH